MDYRAKFISLVGHISEKHRIVICLSRANCSSNERAKCMVKRIIRGRKSNVLWMKLLFQSLVLGF